jgi:hypothetical protein
MYLCIHCLTFLFFSFIFKLFFSYKFFYVTEETKRQVREKKQKEAGFEKKL